MNIKIFKKLKLSAMILKWIENICVFSLLINLLGFVAYIHNRRNGKFQLEIRKKIYFLPSKFMVPLRDVWIPL